MLPNETTITPQTLVAEVEAKKADGWRLITATCNELSETECELIYHFDKDLEMTHLRMTVSKEGQVPSISGVFFAALLIENEVQDQFGLCFEGLVVNFGNHLYLDEEVQRTPFCKFGVVQSNKSNDSSESAG